MLRIRNNHEGFIDAHYSIHGRRAFVSSSSRMSNGFDNFSKHFGNGSNISFMQSHVFPREQIEWLDFLEVQFQSWLNDQEEDERHDRVLARKTRLPDLDYRDIDFVTKCDRRAHGQEAQAMAPGLTGPGPSGQDGPDWRQL